MLEVILQGLYHVLQEEELAWGLLLVVHDESQQCPVPSYRGDVGWMEHLDLHQQCVDVTQDLLFVGVQQHLFDQVADDFFGGIVLAGDKLVQEIQGALQAVLLHSGVHHAQLPTGDEPTFLLLCFPVGYYILEEEVLDSIPAEIVQFF